MDMTNLTGSVVALITPFKKDGSIDYEALERLVEFQIENGTDGILVLGTTGESSTMTDAEDVAVADFVVRQVAGRVPVIGGAGSNATAESMRKSLELQKHGVDGLLLITPYYNKSNEEGIYQHFVQVMDAVNLPCVLYQIPGRTGCSISEYNLERLSRHANAWGVKDATGDIGWTTMAAQYVSSDFRLWSGNDDMVVPLLALGGTGVISVWADVAPRAVHDMVTSFLSGDIEQARRIQLENLELIDALFCEVNPIPVKAALAKMGLIEENYRLPLWPMSDANRERLYRAMRAAQLIDEE